jgi:hypothetical protein
MHSTLPLVTASVALPLKGLIEEKFDGSFEKLLAQCANDRRFNDSIGVPYIDFIALEKWIGDPVKDSYEDEE